MSEKIVIDVNNKNLKTTQRDLSRFQKVVSDTNTAVERLNKTNLVMKFEIDDSKFLQTFEKTNMLIRAFRDAQILAFYAIKSSVDKIINSIYARLQQLTKQTYWIHINIDKGTTLSSLKTIDNGVNSIITNGGTASNKNNSRHTTGKKITKKKKSVPKNNKSFFEKTIDFVVDGAKDYYQSFLDQPIITTLDTIGRALIIRDGAKWLKGSKGGKWIGKSAKAGASWIGKGAKTGANWIKERVTSKDTLKIGAGGSGLKNAATTLSMAMMFNSIEEGFNHLFKSSKADNKYDKEYENKRGITTLSLTASGTAIGALAGKGEGAIYGGAAGSVLDELIGNRLTEKAVGSEKAEKYADKSKNAAIIVARDSTRDFERAKEHLRETPNKWSQITYINGFLDKMAGRTEKLTKYSEKNKKKGIEDPEEVKTYFREIKALKEQAKPPVEQWGSTEKKSPAVDTKLKIDGNKDVKKGKNITASDFGIPAAIKTIVDVAIQANPVLDNYTGGTSGSTVTGGSDGTSGSGSTSGSKGKKGSRAKKKKKSLGETIASGVNTLWKWAKNFVTGKAYRGGIVGGNVPGFAEGGYVQGGAQLITVAEEGTPEAIIPLGKHRRKRAMELFGQVGSYLQAPGFAPKGFAAGGIVGGSIGGGFGGGMPTVVEVGGVEIKVEAKDGQNLVETIRENKEAISEEIAGVFNAAFKGQFANTPASGGASA